MGLWYDLGTGFQNSEAMDQHHELTIEINVSQFSQRTNTTALEKSNQVSKTLMGIKESGHGILYDWHPTSCYSQQDYEHTPAGVEL